MPLHVIHAAMKTGVNKRTIPQGIPPLPKQKQSAHVRIRVADLEKKRCAQALNLPLHAVRVLREDVCHNLPHTRTAAKVGSRKWLRKMVGTTGFEPATSRTPSVRATRLRHGPSP